MRRLLMCLLLCLPVLCGIARADSGTLIPKDKQAPDPTVLSLEEMTVDITIDNGDAHVSVVQIFLNHTAAIQEGTYRFSLPTGATVSDFAVWDGPVRIPAVILERKRAEQVYAQARLQAIDPGLLEMGERDSVDPKNTAVFTAKIAPIPAYGTKRLELEYHQRLLTANFAQFFVLPLKPDAGQQQTAKHFKLHFALHSAQTVEKIDAPAKSFPLSLTDAHTAEASFDLKDFAFVEDFQATWHLAASDADHLELITHYDPQAHLPTAADQPPDKPVAEPGFFEASLLLADPAPARSTSTPPRTLVLLFDNSVSMQWEKLERSYAALEATLHSLKPEDRFNVLLFNQAVTPFQPKPVAASPEAVGQALNFVRQSKLRGGTDLGRALAAGLAQAADENTTLALFTDGGSDRGETILPAKIATQYAARWKRSPHAPHTAVFAVGDDANLTLLRNLSHNGGFLEQVLSTEPVEFHLQSFLSKLTHTPIAGLTLAAPGASLVYPLDDAVYPGSVGQWVGQYKPAAGTLKATATGSRNGMPFTATAEAATPGTASHPQLPRLWAQARVDALLAQIDRDGESAALIDEIIRLSRRYKFVTPYTSFLAVPRSLLRPRVIRPGDPVLRVRTDAAITSVIALFPFGLTKPLRHLATEDLKAPGDEANRLWETRFLAPPDMKDGTYAVRLILRDTHGNTYNEAKTFVIASTPPAVKLQLSRTQLHRGETLELRATATASTRTLTAHLDGANPVTLRWNPRALINTGTLVVPPTLPAGRYTLTVTAEDVAHNLATQEVPIDVIP